MLYACDSAVHRFSRVITGPRPTREGDGALTEPQAMDAKVLEDDGGGAAAVK